jgi:hypothetical protein
MDTQLDPQVKALTSAIGRAETGNDPNAYSQRGASGEYGKYQFTQPTWKQYAKEILGDENADVTSVENQNKVAYGKIKQLKDQGYNPAQIASIWNSGNADAYKQGHRGVNQYGVAYDVPSYVQRVSQNYEQLKQSQPQVQQTGQGSQVEAQKAQLQAQGQPQSVSPDRAEPTFGGKLVRGLIKPFVRGANTLVQGAQLLGGKKLTDFNENSKYLGDISGYGMKQGQTAGQRVKDVLGGALELGSFAVGGGELGAGVNALKEGGLLGKGLVEAGIQGAKQGAKVGALGGVGQELQNPNSTIGSVATQGALGGVLGGATGGLLGAGGKVVGKIGEQPLAQDAKNAIQQKATNTFDTLFRRTPSQTLAEETAGKDSPAHLAQLYSEGHSVPLQTMKSDVTGKDVWDTASAQSYIRDKVISPESDVLRSVIKSEGKLIAEKDFTDQLKKEVLSGFTGSEQQKAEKLIEQELKSPYWQSKFVDGNAGEKYIPLEVVHDLKQDFWKKSGFKGLTRSDKFHSNVFHSAGQSLKNIVENNTDNTLVKDLNGRLSNHYNLITTLKKINAKNVGVSGTGQFLKSLGKLGGASVGGLLGHGIVGEYAGYWTASKIEDLLSNPNTDIKAAEKLLSKLNVKPEVIKQAEKTIAEKAAENASLESQASMQKGTPLISTKGLIKKSVQPTEMYQKESELPVIKFGSGAKKQPTNLPVVEQGSLPKVAAPETKKIPKKYKPDSELPVIEFGKKAKKKAPKLPVIKF